MYSRFPRFLSPRAVPFAAGTTFLRRSLSTQTDALQVNAGGRTISVNPGLFINNEFVVSESAKTFPTINPANGSTIAHIYEADIADIEVAVTAAETAFHSEWKHFSGTQRAALLHKFTDLIEKNFDDLAHLEALDVGKTLKYAEAGDIPRTVECFRYYAGWADKIHGISQNENPTQLAYTRHEPIGVCGCIIPWNFPLLMLAWKLGPLLACGNTAVLKTSEKSPLSALRIAELFVEAGFPPGVVNIVSGFGQPAGEAIASHMRVRKVALTGSIPTGKKIMAAAAASNLKNVSLELGGKSPNIIFEDADLDQAVKWSFRGLFSNHGQSCSAGTRIFVHENIYSEFVEKLKQKANELVLGDQFDPNVTQGPQVDQKQFNTIMDYIQSGKESGAEVVCGGSRFGDSGYFVEPTLFANVTDDMKIVREEIFGPVGTLLKFSSEEEVIQRANNTEYGLAAAVFTTDINKAARVSAALESGSVFVNCYGLSGIHCPFGGYKQSGIGREKGHYALEMFTEVKQVVMNLGK